jgi:hypothetical protein
MGSRRASVPCASNFIKIKKITASAVIFVRAASGN